MIWNISWKNVWRNKTRSMIVVCAIVLGTLGGVFVNGLMKGWVDQRIRSAVYTEMAHLKIRNPEYLKNEEIIYTIPHIDTLIDFLSSSPEVKCFSKHIDAECFATTSWGVTGITVKGIDIEEEMKVSDLYKFIVPNAGSYLDTASNYPILISDKTADQLKIKNYKITDEVLDSLQKSGLKPEIVDKLQPLNNKLYRTEKLFKRDMESVLSKKEMVYSSKIIEIAKIYNLRKKIVLTFVGGKGENVTYPFKICGIFKTSNTAFDQWNAFVNRDDLVQMAKLDPNQYHEISILLNDDEKTLEDFKEKLENKFDDISVMTWKELAPDAGMMADFMQVYYYVIMGFIFFALAFGIINTMLMAILERVKELGMLMAIGMNNKLVFRMIMLETIFLTITGAIIGMVLGWALIRITGHVGLNFASVGEGFEAIGWAAKVYPSIELSFFFGVVIMVIIVGILSSIVPAKKALKLNPAEALRVDM